VNVLLYPLHLCRKFERHWSAKVIQDDGQSPPSKGTGGCTTCGRIVMAPAHATYLPTGEFVNQWRCPVCRNSWQTSADPASSTDIHSSRSEHLRENAGHCLTLEDTAADDAARKQLRRMGDTWLALAETQDWLDGVTPRASRPQSQNTLV
jgi:hypothetical protein